MEPLGVEKVPIDAHVGVRPRSRPDVGRRMERKVEKEAMKRSGSCDWSEKADVDHESDAGSVADEDRLKRLFDTCDTDGDGYITCEDLLYICQELSLEDCFDDIISQLGMQMNSRISFEEFVKCRIALNSEIEALRQESSSAPSATGDSSSGIYPLAFRHGDGASNASGTNTNDYIPTSSENSLERGGLGLVKKQFGDSWEFDSGARDLSPEPRSLQKLLENAGAILPGSSSHLLDVANKVSQNFSLPYLFSSGCPKMFNLGMFQAGTPCHELRTEV
ncbi:unnamed protein product [Darwinula stevensoni]|uniref:EF-hand domain-containing protein n=1 Tax=Darwinula stevensoni TaxID=69355 RepID=A0A7R9A280_9CRUS|nr:unnamed protein product [Darwinula stevensoni]CAG0888173.1 unnamed protein product [Darwinula stevensoni]